MQVSIKKILLPSNTAVNVQDSKEYKQVTVKMHHEGVVLRCLKKGLQIQTKKQTSIKYGQFVISKIDARNGAFGIIPQDLDGAIITNSFVAFDINAELVNIEWFTLFTSSPQFMDFCKRVSSGTTNRKTLDLDKFYSYELFLPSLEEQNQAIKKYNISKNQADNIKSNIDTGSKLTEKFYNAVLNEAAKGELKTKANGQSIQDVLSTFHFTNKKNIKPIIPQETPYTIPKNWGWFRLGQLLVDIRYGTSKHCTYSKKGVPILRIPNLVSGKIDTSDLKFTELNEKELIDLKLSKGDLLIIRSNGSSNLVGRSAVVEEGLDGYGFAGYLIRIRTIKEFLEAKYLYYILESPLVRRQIEGPIRTTSGVKNINSTELSNLLIPLPPCEIQEEIVKTIEATTKHLAALKQHIQTSEINYSVFLKALNKEVFDYKLSPVVVSPAPALNWFALKQGIGAVLSALAQTSYERGEMVVAKFMYLLQEVKGVPFGLDFVRHNFGPYDPNIKKAILASAFNKDKFFRVKGSGDRQVYSLGDNANKLFSYTSRILDQTNSKISELMPFLSKAKSSQIELLATVCKIIQDTKSTDPNLVKKELTEWKGTRFSGNETDQVLKFIFSQNWDKVLIK